MISIKIIVYNRLAMNENAEQEMAIVNYIFLYSEHYEKKFLVDIHIIIFYTLFSEAVCITESKNNYPVQIIL